MGQASQGVSLWFFKHEGITQFSLIEQKNPLTFGLPPSAATVGWKDLGEVIDVSLSGIEATVVNMRHLASPAYFNEKKRGFRDAGSITVQANYIDTQLARLLYLFKDHVVDSAATACYQTDVRWWDIRIPDETCNGLYNRFSFMGFLKTTGLEIPEDDRIVTPIEIEITGYPVLTPVSGTSLLDGPSSGSFMSPFPGTAYN